MEGVEPVDLAAQQLLYCLINIKVVAAKTSIFFNFSAQCSGRASPKAKKTIQNPATVAGGNCADQLFAYRME